jgi:hypothetical protein
LISLGTYTARILELSVFEALFGKQMAIFELGSGRIEADGATASGLYVVGFDAGFSGKLLDGSANALSEGRLFSSDVLGLVAVVVEAVSSLAGWLCAGRVGSAVVATADEMLAVLVPMAGKVEVLRLDVLWDDVIALVVDKLVSPVSDCVVVLPVL